MAIELTAKFLALQEALAGRYSLEREIGRGGMGIVYLAQEVRLDRPVALKLLPPDHAARPELRERFLREARTAAKLSHPHIVPIHAVDEVEGFVFFVMAYVEGETLGERIRGRGPVPPREAARILREVSWALGYAHAQGVVHRDVKPDNILLEAGTGRALVTDFGIAQVTGSGLTSANEVLGTAEFMSPEQASGEAVDERSDVYALGVVGHYMLSGRLPFEGASVAATLAKQITQPAPALAAVAPEVPRSLSRVVDRCLEKEPDARFGEGGELAEALSRAIETRREIPAALRAFVSEHREQLRGIWGVLLLAGYMLIIAAVALFEGEVLPAALAAAFATLIATAPGWMLVRMARQLLRSGHGRDELVAAMKADLEVRREELGFGTRASWFDRLASWLAWGGLGVSVAATGSMLFIDSFAGMVAAGLTLVFGGLTSLVAAPFAATGFTRRKGVPGARALKFWESRPGRWIFGLAGIGLDRPLLAAGGYRPTEMAIGMAADRLFEELPRDQRKQFAELPGVVRALEAHAERMRQRLRELDGILHDVARGGGSEGRDTAASVASVGEKRSSLAGDLRGAREAAEQRLAEVVAALETIRLELLRLHAGVGSVEGMTADLGSARELAEDLERLLEGSREVDDLLGIEGPLTPGDTPSPVPT